MATLPPEDPERRREATVWGAYVSHLAATLSLAPSRGHPAYVYQSLRSILCWATEYPGRLMGERREQDATGVAALNRTASEVADLAEQIQALLLDPLQAIHRTRACLAAANQLLDLTKARV
jgi:hypothetical protein